MVRLLFSMATVALGIVVPLTHDVRETGRSSPQVDTAQTREALDVSSLVRTRFYISGIAAMCAQVSRRDAYELLLSHFNERGRAIVQSAADDGFRDGVATVREAGGRVDCDEAARNLAAVERTLSTRAEILRPPS